MKFSGTKFSRGMGELLSKSGDGSWLGGAGKIFAAWGTPVPPRKKPCACAKNVVIMVMLSPRFLRVTKLKIRVTNWTISMIFPFSTIMLIAIMGSNVNTSQVPAREQEVIDLPGLNFRYSC